MTIYLPSATPHAYLAWVSWWRDVEELIGSDFAQPATGASGEAPPAAEEDVPSIVVDHIRSVEAAARQAIDQGRDRMAPRLSAQAEQWDQWLRYGRKRGAWLDALALREVPVPHLPEDLAVLWRETLRTIEATVSDGGELLNLRVIPGPQPGLFALRGELEIENVEVVAERLQAELRAGHRLQLDLSGLTFLDSVGIHLLTRLAAQATELGLAPIALLSPPPHIGTVIEIALPGGAPGIEIR